MVDLVDMFYGNVRVDAGSAHNAKHWGLSTGRHIAESQLTTKTQPEILDALSTPRTP